MTTNTSSKILLVDDEPDILEFLSYNLKKNNFEIDVAISGQEALEKVNSFKPDLIVLDIMMPEMDGVEVCRRIRENPANHKLIIVYLSARGEDYTQIAALDNGGDDFISKPIKPAVFLSKIKALLRRSDGFSQNSSPQIISVGDITIDREQFVVKKLDEEIELAKKEFQLLSLMISNPGKVFTREEIFRKIWGNNVIVGNRTIDVHIRKIREKIGDGIIKTIKGIGYKFDL